MPRRLQEVPGLAARLKAAREAKDWSQAELARRTKTVRQGAISRIENGKRSHPGAGTIAALERALGVKLRSPAEASPSLSRFLASDLAARLRIGPDERAELAEQWWSGDSEPTDEEWYDYVRLRRTVAARSSGHKPGSG